ncbi:MAG: tetratricopeptide repeat protein [Kiritimatiellia bacterium]
MRNRLIPGLLLMLLVTAAFVLTCRLTASGIAVATDRSEDALESLLGGSRIFLGGLAMNRADLYLHRGLVGNEATAFSNRWFQRMHALVSPNVLEHREGAEGMKDVLPWVTLAARAAPTNTDYVLTQTFLFRATGNPQRALQEVRRVRANQPQNPELWLEESRIRLALNQWDRATAGLDSCARLIGTQPSPEQSPLLAETCMWRGLLYERTGDSNSAATFLMQAIRLEPQMYGALSNRVAALQAGLPPPVPVTEVLAKYRRMAANPLCTHDHEQGHAHDEDDE